MVIKKLFLCTAMVVATLMLMTCTMFAPDEPGISKESLPRETSFTVYLDDNAPPANQRALNVHLAQMGYDFFEVVFMSQAGVARTSWELGQAAGISGVRRGVDYSSVDPANVGNGTGAAVMFLGDKYGKTLLAIGRISHINDVPVTTLGNAIIENDSRSVTFTVSALTGAVNIVEDYSSFLTGPNINSISLDGTDIRSRPVGPHRFPLYMLESGTAIGARYTFGMTGDTLTTYEQAILQAGTIILERLEPTYTDNYGVVYSTDFGVMNTWVSISPVNNVSIGDPFENPVLVTFNTATTPTNTNTVFSFLFSVPVNALSSASGGEAPVTWYIRPGFGEYVSDLDTGSGSGGAILLGTESTSSPSDPEDPPEQRFYLNITSYPSRDPYPLTGTIIFADLEVQFVDEGTYTWDLNLWDTLLSDPRVTVTFDDIEVTPDNYTTFTYSYTTSGFKTITITFDLTDPASASLYSPVIPNEATGTVYTVSFNVLVGSLDDVEYRFVGEINEFNIALNTLTSGKVLVMVLMHNRFDISSNITINASNCVIIFVAAASDIILGRTNNSTIGLANNTNEFYFGTWPLDRGLYIYVPVITQGFTVNATGSAYDLTDTSLRTPYTFFSGGTPSAVVVDDDVIIYNDLDNMFPDAKNRLP